MKKYLLLICALFTSVTSMAAPLENTYHSASEVKAQKVEELVTALDNYYCYRKPDHRNNYGIPLFILSSEDRVISQDTEAHRFLVVHRASKCGCYDDDIVSRMQNLAIDLGKKSDKPYRTFFEGEKRSRFQSLTYFAKAEFRAKDLETAKKDLNSYFSLLYHESGFNDRDVMIDSGAGGFVCFAN